MGPDRMGPPGGPDMHHMAMRGFHEIIRRLARIEEKLGIENAPPSGPMEGRRRMEEAKGRMEEARKRLQAMEERIKQLEAEVERLKAAK
jgi:tetrahydromethanopterin S-methyltransferase subunit G